MLEKVSEEETKGVSRRKFLKDAGLVAGGAAIGSIAIMNACSGSTQTVSKTTTVTATSTVTVEPAAKGATVPQAHLCWDPILCTGCQTCQLICSTSKRGRTGPSLAAIGHFHDDFGSSKDYEPSPCLQCEDPACLKACKFDAMFIDPVLGIAVVDEKKCTGCGQCIKSCPFSPPRIFGPDPKTNTYFKCDLCHGDPLCVKWCPNGALKYKTLAAFKPEVAKGIPVENSYHLELLDERLKELSYPRGEKK